MDTDLKGICLKIMEVGEMLETRRDQVLEIAGAECRRENSFFYSLFYKLDIFHNKNVYPYFLCAVTIFLKLSLGY